jgi:hypothetical protein
MNLTPTLVRDYLLYEVGAQNLHSHLGFACLNHCIVTGWQIGNYFNV